VPQAKDVNSEIGRRGISLSRSSFKRKDCKLRNSLTFKIMATHNIVVFAGDHCGPEVSFIVNRCSKLRNFTEMGQVVAEALKVRGDDCNFGGELELT
jgi:hypothetical protein